MLVRGSRSHVVPVELVDDDPVCVHRRPSCYGNRNGGASVMLYAVPVPWWEAIADCAIDLGVPACRECASKAADLVDAYHLESDDCAA